MTHLLLMKIIDSLKKIYFSQKSKREARVSHPDTLTIDLDDLLSNHREIKVAIIDNDPFPWIEAIKQRGCKVEHFFDYTKPISQSNQRIKPIDLSSYDIVFCDINDVGENLYPGLGGIGVLEELRQKNPFQVILAYTGDPGSIAKRMKKKEAIDGIFCRDWALEDFLFNFDEALKIFRSPKQRWDFVRKRLAYLEIPGATIERVREKYVESVLYTRYLKEKLNYTADTTRQLILSSGESNIDYAGLLKHGISAGKAVSLITPYIWGGE